MVIGEIADRDAQAERENNYQDELYPRLVTPASVH
jgi:hypothetical protein